MTKIGITADIHFGVPGRTDDILWACRVMREYCAKFELDTMLVLGDLYHNRQAIEVDINSTVCQFFEETKEKYEQQWIVFPGNHDMFLRHSWNINSLTALRRHMTVIEGVKLLEIDNRRFWVLPFITYEKAYMRVLKAIVNHPEFRPGEDNLLTHIGIRGATLNTCFLLKDWSIIDFEEFPFHRIYTGHFHSKQQIGENVWYPGSPIPFKFDEGDVPHGFYVYDLEEDSHKFINIWKAGTKFFPDEVPPPQFITVLDESLEHKSTDDIKDCMVRVALQRDYTSDEKTTIKHRLIAMGARDVRWMEMKQKEVVEFNESEPDSAPELHQDLFNAWIEKDSKGLNDLDLKILARCNDEVTHEGDELYAVEATDI